jgi:hypothetical protein
MSYERDEAMRQEATEAVIRMREPRGSGAHPDPMQDHRMEPRTMGDSDADHVQHSIAIRFFYINPTPAMAIIHRKKLSIRPSKNIQFRLRLKKIFI